MVGEGEEDEGGGEDDKSLLHGQVGSERLVEMSPLRIMPVASLCGLEVDHSGREIG